MKALGSLIIVLVSVAMISCSNVVYRQAMPVNQPQLTEFPEFLHGNWIDAENDTLFIGQTDFRYGNFNGSSLFAGSLNNETVLKQMGHFFLLNFKNPEGYWEIVATHCDTTNLYIYCVGVENEIQLKALNSHLKKRNAKSLRKEGKYMIDPTTKEFLDLLQDEQICKVSTLKKLN